NLASLTDPAGNTTTFGYDKANRQVTEADPLGKVTHYGYDPDGNRTQIIDRNGRKRTFEFDNTNMLAHELWWDGTTLVRTISYSYDMAGNVLAESDPDSSYKFTYDALNRLTSVDNAGSPGMPHVILTYAYDKNGNRISVTDDTGVTVASTFN